MTAYSVDDNRQYTRHFVQQVLRVLSLFAMWRASDTKLMSFRFLVALMYLFFTVLLLSMNGGMIYARMTASSFLDEQSRHVQVHMKTEHTQSPNYDAVTLKGYRYPFYEDDFQSQDTMVTLDMIWRSEEGLLRRGSDGRHLKEVCLAFSLFRLLRRRFFGLDCPEAKVQKTRDLVFKGLLSDAEAAYRVIEAELAFAHDHFFTSSASFNTKLGNVIILLSIVKSIVYPVAILCSIKDFIHGKSNSSNSAPIVTAIVIMLVLIALELLQLYLYLSSNWAKVKLVRRSIYFFSQQARRWSIWSIFGEDTCFGFFGVFNCLGLDTYCNKLPMIFGLWQNKIGQHALLKDLHGRSYIADIMGGVSGFVFGKCLEFHPVFSRGILNSGIKGSDHIQLTTDVKFAIARTLEASKGHLSNGASSLQRNKQKNRLSWACHDQEYHTGTMLIWHVATEYCDIAKSCGNEEVDDTVVPNRTIATTLSSYCAYLIAFVPELVPDEELETRITFQEVRRDALRMLSQDRTLHEKYARMRNFKGHSSNDGILVKGIHLGRKIEDIGDDNMIWKLLADFWTEMILYIAPSDNAKAHIEHLANGGEFLTHLWALLCHAGILGRGE